MVRLIDYDYDPNGRMELVEDPTSWATYEYDTRGRMSKESFSNGVYSAYGYDIASRLTSLNHKKTIDNSVILGYTATYDAASRLTQAVESPATATTAYAYDNANRLTSEDRTGANPYLSDYTYNSVGLRATAFRSEGGIASHDGLYTYDDAGRLTQVVDFTGTDNFTWYDDGSLKTYPGPGYERLLDYDEESHLTSIKRDYGTSQTLAFEYAYGFDGGRRWRKDHANNVWNWYPCGVACCAGELVDLRSDLTGATWSQDVSKLSGNGLVHANLEYPLYAMGMPRLALDSQGNTTAVTLRDSFRVERRVSQYWWVTLPNYSSGLATAIFGPDDEALFTAIYALAIDEQGPPTPPQGVLHIAADLFNGDCFDCLRYTTGEARNIRDNAIRHCVWACKSVKRCGMACAKQIIWKEVEDAYWDHDPWSDIGNDAYNNMVGWSLGDIPARDCNESCRIAKANGDLAL